MSASADLQADPGIRRCRRLHLVLGDQLRDRGSAWDDFDDERDCLLLAEVMAEQAPVPVHAQRSVLFLSAMRHFALEQQAAGRRVRYLKLDARGNTGTLGGELRRAVQSLRPERVTCVEAGEWRVQQELDAAAAEGGFVLEWQENDHFLCTRSEFEAWAEGRKQLVMEHFYRWMRKRRGVLLDEKGGPVGGEWNYDAQNREAFREAPVLREPYRPRSDEITREVVELIQRRLPDAPGRLAAESFRWPVTRGQARRALADFVDQRLPDFGRYQDAMWTGEAFLHHALLSPPLNLGLLDPQELIDAALKAWESGSAPLNSVEGFVRQVLGWREFVRGVYWNQGPGYRDRNALEATGKLPDFFWTGDTDLACLRDSIEPVLEHGWAHHIQRLMLQCNFALTAGVEPRAVGDWFYGMFVDAVDWVTTPNTIGMGLHADGGVVGSKPYAASGKYVQRMSNHCESCEHDPKRRTGEGACPLNTLYWDFLERNAGRLAGNRRMTLVLRGLERLADTERAQIRREATALRRRLGVV